jgi:hypothetical protein
LLTAHATFTCPRCFHDSPVREDVRFCPHCGLADAVRAAEDTSPIEIVGRGRTYLVADRIAIGSVCTIYRCRFAAEGGLVEGVFKVVRDASTNAFVGNEADVLRQLHAADDVARYAPFLPIVEDTLNVGENANGTSPTARRGNVLRMHPAIASPDELYTLDEVRAAHPAGLDARDMAWIWRRLLSVLGFAHKHDVVHTAVLPMHVLIEPRDHKLLLVDWCAAISGARKNPRPPQLLSMGHLPWYGPGGADRPATPGLDVAMAARCMIHVVGGDSVGQVFPYKFDPRLEEYFRGCLGATGAADAWQLLSDFDRLIERLWGKRRFRVLTMPPKRGR